MKPFLTQQALFRATENTYIQSNHKHLPTLHWKYLKKFHVKRNCILASKKKIMLQLLEKRNIWVRQYFLNSPPPPIWRTFLSCFLPPLYKIWQINQRGGGVSFKNIAPPPCTDNFTIIFEPCEWQLVWRGRGANI